MIPVIVLCTYNEADNIAQVLDGLRDYAVLLLDGGSTDGTPGIARRFANVRVHEVPTRGVADAYRRALRLALDDGWPVIVQMDAGLTHRAEDVPQLLRVLDDRRADLVIGARDFRWQGPRTLVSRAAALLMRLAGYIVMDATSGFRAWRAETLRAALEAPGLARGHAFQLETLAAAMRAGARIVEVLIPYELTTSTFSYGQVVEGLRTWARLAVGR